VEVAMKKTIKKVAVLGSGVMGSSIAAHMANARLDTFLLDIVPSELDEKDIKKGLTRESPEFRNKLARTGLEKALKSDPASFFIPENARLIIPGNFEDDISCIKEADWIIEVVVENIGIKNDLFKRIESFRRADAIVSTNTSGLSVNQMVEGLSKEFQAHFLGTHFFNPPRYMKLIEIVPGEQTSQEVIDLMTDFCERRLGKGIVLAKDAPNFIANRIGIHNVIAVIKAMQEEGFTLEEVDAITGPPLGRPKSATFRTLDMVGLDTLLHVAGNAFEKIDNAAEKKEFILPDFIKRMIDSGLLGDKTGKGFYQKAKTEEGSKILTINPETLEYAPQQKARIPTLDFLSQVQNTADKLKILINTDDRVGHFAWKVVKKLLLYSASKIPEIADDIVNVDKAMKWGFNQEMGPFEAWDAIGVKESVERMEKEGEQVPENVLQMLRQGKVRFYQQLDSTTYYYDFRKADYAVLTENSQIILLPSLKTRNKLIRANSGASLVDLGNGVACLEFHSPNNTIGADVVDMINFSLVEISRNYEGLVIGHHSNNFCVGANLMLILFEAQSQEWDELDFMIRQFQNACMNIKLSEKPVVTAPFRMTLGGGCEICMASSRVRAYAETYIGLVEVGVGLIPAGGGTKEILLRNTEGVPASVPSINAGDSPPDLIPFVIRAFETVANARVSTSAQEGKKLGYLRTEDKYTFNEDYLLNDAKNTVLALAKEGFIPHRKRDDIRVVGRTGFGVMEAILYNLKEGALISEFDAHIARKIAFAITGGGVEQNTLVTEDYLLDLEREAFLSLCGEAKSQQRMQAMLQTGKPLRN